MNQIRPKKIDMSFNMSGKSALNKSIAYLNYYIDSIIFPIAKGQLLLSNSQITEGNSFRHRWKYLKSRFLIIHESSLYL